jgi:glycosyltransferase involved in cell wall biosynthesis
MAEARPLILIPSYNTGRILRETVAGVLEYGVPAWVVIDGSTDGSPALLDEFQGGAHPDFRVISLERNSGKGAAILHALKEALNAGFTHVLTMDSDGQHPAAFIPRFLEISARHPEAAVFGKPIFDASAPALRVNGRKVSNFWAHLETLCWGVGDSLFGMRLYPAARLLTAMRTTFFARRFDFEPEVAVRLCWLGVPIINLPTPVRYPGKDEGGVSQFRYLRDNTLLTWMHFRLLIISLIILPWLILRGRNPLRHVKPEAP